MGIIETLQAEIQALKERVTALEQIEKKRMYDEAYNDYLNGDLDETIENAVKEARQLTRDDIIEMAKRDVAELLSENYVPGSTPKIETSSQSVWFVDDWPFEIMDECEFIVNREKRTVVALIKTIDEGEVVHRGIAKCHPDDCFNAHIGRAIALRRALGLEVPEAYLNAPQPTEVKVGDVVCGADDDSYYSTDKRFTITSKYEAYDAFRYAEDPSDWICRDQIGKVIDDTREEV